MIKIVATHFEKNVNLFFMLVSPKVWVRSKIGQERSDWTDKRERDYIKDCVDPATSPRDCHTLEKAIHSLFWSLRSNFSLFLRLVILVFVSNVLHYVPCFHITHAVGLSLDNGGYCLLSKRRVLVFHHKLWQKSE